MQEAGEEDEGSGDDGEVQEDGERDTTETGQFNTFNWLYQINRVSDRTTLNWTQVWDLNVFEFLNYLQFDIEYRKWEEREIKMWKQNH